MEYNIRKLYLDAFPAVTSAGGQRYPQVNQAITNDVGNSLYLFYFGHGGINGWAQERILSSTEIQGFNDAVFNVRNSKKPATCAFSHGIYEANGSRSDNFEEGPQKITSMRQIAELMPSRDFTIYDQEGKPISKEDVNKLFYIISSNQYGINKIGLTKFALQNCSKKQLGK